MHRHVYGRVYRHVYGRVYRHDAACSRPSEAGVFRHVYIHVDRHMYRHVYFHVYGHVSRLVLSRMFLGIGPNTCKDMCVDVRVGMCVHMRPDMCVDICFFMRLLLGTGLITCLDMRMAMFSVMR